MTDWADLTKLTHGEKLSVKKNSTELHENPTNGLVADTRWQTEGRTDMAATWGLPFSS